VRRGHREVLQVSYSNYQQIRDHLIENEPFEGNTMRATLEDGVYRVYSYTTVIYKELPDGRCIFNQDKYSRTTTKHQNLVWSVKHSKIEKSFKGFLVRKFLDSERRKSGE